MQELNNNSLVPAYKDSDDTRKYFQAQNEQLRAILQELGMARANIQ